VIDTRARRREAKRDQILAAAWTLAHRDGLGGISLRELADLVELRQPSLYAYFASKSDLYDAMFEQGNRALVQRTRALRPNADARGAVLDLARMLLDFVTEDVVRYVLMFQRPIPGFVPSSTSYAVAIEFYELARETLGAAGVTAQEDVDLFTTLVAGLADQQTANDPGGARWVGLTERVIAMFFNEIDAKPTSKRKASR
jgi:AcrR family transcriptional regulator